MCPLTIEGVLYTSRHAVTTDPARASSIVFVATIVAKETYYYIKRDLLLRQKRPPIQQKGPATTAKETYYYSQRDLLQQKRPSTTATAAWTIPPPKFLWLHRHYDSA